MLFVRPNQRVWPWRGDLWVWPPTGREDRERRRVEDWTEMILFVHMCFLFLFFFVSHSS